jgi:hypothetical protein
MIKVLMERVRKSETSANLYETTRLSVPKDNHLHTRCTENLKLYMKLKLCNRTISAKITDL